MCKAEKLRSSFLRHRVWQIFSSVVSASKAMRMVVTRQSSGEFDEWRVVFQFHKRSLVDCCRPENEAPRISSASLADRHRFSGSKKAKAIIECVVFRRHCRGSPSRNYRKKTKKMLWKLLIYVSPKVKPPHQFSQVKYVVASWPTAVRVFRTRIAFGIREKSLKYKT